MKLTANVVGATGLIGKQLVRLLLENENFEEVRIFVRRDAGITNPKLEQRIVDFGNVKTWEEHLSGDVLFSALGTTLKQAGSKEKEYEVDFTYNLNFAQAAKTNGIKNYVLVSSIGANAKSTFFYPRMKGELDEAIKELGFKNLAVMRPSYLMGDRNEKRILEQLSLPFIKFLTRFMLKKYRPIQDEKVARAMVNSVLKPNPEKTIWEGDEIFSLADM